MAAEPQGAASIAEGGAVDLTGYDWASLGERADAGVSVYEPRKEPLAETDNDWNFSQRTDDKLLNEALGDLEDRVDAIDDELTQVANDLDELEDVFWSHNHDDRYYRKYLANERFVNETDGYLTVGSGDYLTGGGRIDLEGGRTLNVDAGALEDYFDDVFVDEAGDTMTGPLHLRNTKLSLDGASHEAYLARGGPELEVVLDEGNPTPDAYEFAIGIGEHPEAGGERVFRIDNGGVTHEGQRLATRRWVQETAVDETGDTMTGSLGMSDNTISGVEFLQFYPDDAQYIDIDTTAGRFGWRDANDELAYSYGDRHTFHTGQARFEGGSVYFANTSGPGNNNDSYDLVFENEPSGKDFRLHFKRDPEDSSLEGDIGMLFSDNGQGPILAVDVDSQITYVSEIRSKRDNRSGTPIAQGDFAVVSDIGEIWYDFDADEFRGKKRFGNMVRLG